MDFLLQAAARAAEATLSRVPPRVLPATSWTNGDALARAGNRISGFAPKIGARMQAVAMRHTYEPELGALAQLSDPDRLCLDIGANWGVYSFELARLGREVVAFEPVPALLRDLTRVAPGARIEPYALSDRAGIATLRMPVMASGVPAMGFATLTDRPFDVAVELRTLDSFALRNVGFIKIDVEGHECAVIAGGLETIRRDMPMMLIEATDDPEPLVSMLEREGYRCLRLDGGTLRPWLEVEQRTNNLIFRAVAQ